MKGYRWHLLDWTARAKQAVQQSFNSIKDNVFPLCTKTMCCNIWTIHKWTGKLECIRLLVSVGGGVSCTFYQYQYAGSGAGVVYDLNIESKINLAIIIECYNKKICYGLLEILVHVKKNVTKNDATVNLPHWNFLWGRSPS